MVSPTKTRSWPILTDFGVADEEMYEGYDEEEMDYEGDIGDDNEDGISDEDEDLDGMGPIEGLSGDHGVDVEVIMEEEGSDDDDDEDDDEEDSDEDIEDDDDDMDDMDDDEHSHGHVEIVDEHGNVLHAEHEDDDEWQSDDEEEIDYEGDGADDEEGLSHPLEHMAHGPLGHLVRALNGDDHEGAVEILQRIDDDQLENDDQMDIEGYLHDPQDEEGMFILTIQILSFSRSCLLTLSR